MPITFRKAFSSFLFLPGLIFLAAAIAVAPAKAEATSADLAAAREFISKLADDTFEVLNDTRLTQDERDAAFRALLHEGFDLEYVSRLVLGRFLQQASREQMADYQAVFPEFVINVYARRLTEFGDEVFRVTGAVPAGKRGDMYVQSQLIRSNGAPPVAADWRVRRQDDGFKIIDLKVEGISMVVTQRDEFMARIDREGMDQLIRDLQRGTIATASADTD